MLGILDVLKVQDIDVPLKDTEDMLGILDILKVSSRQAQGKGYRCLFVAGDPVRFANAC